MSRKKGLYERHEAEFAEAMPGGQQTLLSGRGYEKLDVQTERDGGYWRFLFSLKCSEQKGIRVTHELWEEVEDAVYARSSEIRPGLGIRLYEPSGLPPKSAKVLVDLVAVRVDDLAELLADNKRLRERAAATEVGIGRGQ